jgi:hypothetical protein
MELHAKPCIEIVILLRYSSNFSKGWNFCLGRPWLPNSPFSGDQELAEKFIEIAIRLHFSHLASRASVGFATLVSIKPFSLRYAKIGPILLCGDCRRGSEERGFPVQDSKLIRSSVPCDPYGIVTYSLPG